MQYLSLLVGLIIALSSAASEELLFHDHKTVEGYLESLKLDPNRLLTRREIDQAIDTVREGGAWSEKHERNRFILDSKCDFYMALLNSIPELKKDYGNDDELRIGNLLAYLGAWQRNYPARVPNANLGVNSENQDGACVLGAKAARFATQTVVPSVGFKDSDINQVVSELNSWLGSMNWVDDKWKVVTRSQPKSKKAFTLQAQDITILELMAAFCEQCGLKATIGDRVIEISAAKE